MRSVTESDLTPRLGFTPTREEEPGARRAPLAAKQLVVAGAVSERIEMGSRGCEIASHCKSCCLAVWHLDYTGAIYLCSNFSMLGTGKTKDSNDYRDAKCIGR